MNKIKLAALLVILPCLFAIPYLIAIQKAPDVELSGISPLLDIIPVTESPYQLLGSSFKHEAFDPGNFKEKLPYLIQTPEKPWPEELKFPLIIHLSDINTPPYSAAYLNQYKLNYPAFNFVPELKEDAIWGYHTTTQSQPLIHLVMATAQDLIKKYPIDTDRIYIVGCGYGGTGALSAIHEYNDLFAGAIAHSADWDKNKIGAIKNTPLLMITGTDDEVIPAQITRNLAAALKNENAPVHYKEIGSMKHTCSYPKLYSSKTWSWLFNQNKTQ